MNDTSVILLLLGVCFTLAYSGYFLLSLGKWKRTEALTRPKIFAGLISLGLGLIASSAWIFFMTQGWRDFLKDPMSLTPHVGSQLICALSLVVSGIALLRGSRKGAFLLTLSMGAVIFSALLSVGAYGTAKHPMLMNGIAIVLLIVGVNLAGLVYLWEHYVFEMDAVGNARDSGASPPDAQKRCVKTKNS